ncbi:uncharacterized protein LOC115564123 isoform X2 [Drosophila navojoa]|uniref:uncharacterized protein LOC115564123 isoform X1 n=1 Tax=Drosophila navojoa TaxID=7232 RepID=UPI0011BD792C|nr:uncharacterized protein LOC115564123 isoform X1 [Drosophila navojoa]XP_030243926.1 uncharacterized protein LOC115564123 isoform X2 [Drosophila navojoa]
MASNVANFDDEFEKYLHRLFYVTPTEETSKCDPSNIEYFGVLSLTDVRSPDRKLWYIYYSKQPEVDETLNRIFHKYGKKNMCEIFRKPTFSGVGLRDRVKRHFQDKKWYVKGNILEAPPKSPYNDDRMLKMITELYNDERKMLYNYICMTHDSFIKYHS